MPQSVPIENLSLFTLPQIARELNVRNHRVEYVVNEFRIEPAMRAANARLWTRDKVEAIRQRLQMIDSRRAPYPPLTFTTGV